MGATTVPGGATVRLWAPAAQRAYVLTGDALRNAEQPGFVPNGDSTLFPLGDGTWSAFLPDVGEGTPYRFWVVGTGSTGLKRDPRARELGTVPAYPVCDCIVRTPQSYPWHDDGFRTPAFNDLALYQLHIGTFYAVDANGNDKRRSIGKFLDLLERIDYFRELGINGLQLMPVQEYPSETSRGYNGLDLYSPEIDYQVNDPQELQRYLTKVNALFAARGQSPLTLDHIRPGPNQLKCVIDLLHLTGISVLLDLVFNHAGPGFNDQCLKFVDRQPTGDDNRSAYFTDQTWAGGNVFAYWNEDVRAFLIENATQCIEEFHIDGIRYDEVTVIDTYGGGQFCQDLAETIRWEKPQAIQIAEYWGDDRATAIRPTPGGLGFDAAWSDRVRQGIRSAVSQARGGRDAYVDMDALAQSMTVPQGFDAAWKTVNMLEDHDTVFDGRQQRIAFLADPNDRRSWYARSRTRWALGLLFAAPGIPQIFMGQEFLEDKQWSDDTIFHADLLIWWDGLKTDRVMRDFNAFCRDLLHVRSTLPGLRGGGAHIWVVNENDRVMAVHRWIDGVGCDVQLVYNLQEFNRYGYRIGFPSGGGWREVFNSDFYDTYPNPNVCGNYGMVSAQDTFQWNGMPASAVVTLPANGFVIFAR
ncbi:alpha amylase catalytic region [Burkholderia sp. H160]|nr:alpha amylase catalytic region [Burkholderia sp. H160]